MNDFREAQKLVINWADRSGILYGNGPLNQLLKTHKDLEFLTDAVKSLNVEKIVYGVGGTLVNIIILCELLNVDPVDSLIDAYDEIRGNDVNK